jgi:micrococcal nuclease
MIRALILPLLLLAAPHVTSAEAAIDVAIAPKNPANIPASNAANLYVKCGKAKRISCAVDSDTFWHRGAKIRIADINMHETSRPVCAYEAGLGARATLRLTQLLNAGPFALEQQGRDVDRYGRQLRIVTRDGRSQTCVIDGDTILIGYPPKGRKIRMSDYNAPEIKGECPAESALALGARAALLEWLNRGPFEMSGGDDPAYDKYGRELRAFKRTSSDGSDDWLVETILASNTARSEWGDRAAAGVTNTSRSPLVTFAACAPNPGQAEQDSLRLARIQQGATP